MDWELPRELLRAIPDGALRLDGKESFLTGVSSLWEQAQAMGESVVREALGGMTEILLLLILAGIAEAMLSGTQEKNKGYVTLAAGTAILLSAVGDVDHLMGLGEQTIYDLERFSKVLLPVMAAATASMGYAGAAAVRQVSTVLVGDLLLSLIRGLLLPLIWLQLSALGAGCLLGEGRLKAIANAVRKGIVWLLGSCLTAFTLYLTVTGAVVGSVDAAALRTAKRAVAGAVPVVGGVLSAVTETVLAGAGMLRNSIGIFGILGVFAVCLLPFLRLGVQYLLFKLTAFLATAIASQPLADLLDGIGSVFGLVLGAVGSCAAVLLVSLLASLLAVTP